MARIELCGVTRRYGDVCAVNKIDLDVRDNEFFVLFGPAGAGKTTTLKCIAGVEFPNEGLVKINGEIVNHIEPAYRNVSMVFENYALYPHLSVYDNMASPLRSKLYKKSESEIKTAIDSISKLMKIDQLYERKPSQLSNGQRQRVAIGRCLVRQPNVFLMDEPLAHLDAKLRHVMRSELKEMQSAFNTTTIYVTHDYMEAMSLADRIAVMNQGEIVQLGAALEMYYRPNCEFVAKLFGEPEINIIPAAFRIENGNALITEKELGFEYAPEPDVAAALQKSGAKGIDVAIRGNDIEFSFEQKGEGWIKGSVFANEPIGNKVIMTAEVKGAHIRLVAPNDTRAALDQDVYLHLKTENALYFDADTQKLITRHSIPGAVWLKHLPKEGSAL